jgi:hypothetical protein
MVEQHAGVQIYIVYRYIQYIRFWLLKIQFRGGFALYITQVYLYTMLVLSA